MRAKILAAGACFAAAVSGGLATGPRTSFAVTTLEKHRGFDRCGTVYPATGSGQSMQTLYSASNLSVVAPYIGGQLSVGCGSASATAPWVSAIVGQGWNLVPLYDYHHPSCAPGQGFNTSGANYPIDTNLLNAYNEGKSDGADAIVQAYSRGLNGPIALDVEPDTTNGSPCAQSTDYYEAGFIDQIHTNASYKAFIYSGEYSLVRTGSFGHPPDGVVYAHWGTAPGVYAGATVLPSSYYVLDQRGHQYSAVSTQGNISYGGQSWGIDLTCWDTAAAGPNSHPYQADCTS
ncbi:MAG: peptidoglycan-binding protein [Ilumatobacteraceae bacterium]|nr:peptidoglycan-binding protein [Ilumatobacteraceae bacterium]